MERTETQPSENDAPITSVREHDSWWWERPGNAGDLGYNRPDVLFRCARIWGGRVKVIHQQVTTVTTARVIPSGEGLTDDEREVLLHAFGFQFRAPGDHEKFSLAIREVERIVAVRVQAARAEASV